MKTTYRRMHFFRLDLYSIIKDGRNADKQDFLRQTDKNLVLTDVLNKINKLKNNQSIRVNKNNSGVPGVPYAIMEILSSDDNYVFGKIGNEKDIRAFQLRHKGTLKAKPLQKEINEIFEAFSYFLIDRKTFAVSYLQEQSAPDINYIAKLFTQEYTGENRYNGKPVWGQIVSLFDEDAIPIVSGKAIISSVSYKMSLDPTTDKEITGLSEKEYKKMVNQKSIDIEVTLRADKRKTSVFEGQDEAEGFLKNLLKGKKNVEVKAKDEDEDLAQLYKLINNPVVKKVKFELNESLTDSEDIQSSIKSQMEKLYSISKPDILKHVGFTIPKDDFISES